jgi:uncharacterized membrane protein SpoIIM required for sporulation
MIAVLLTVIGSLVPLSDQDANKISNDLNQTITTNRANGTLAEYIFLNNFSICLLMFIPVIGPILGFLILFDTGVALGAIASVQGYSPLLAFALLVITPIFWLEFASYSIGITESIWLFRRLLQRRWREFKNMGILIGICAILLLLGAIVEAWLISFAG